jgi:hypothetical protein
MHLISRLSTCVVMAALLLSGCGGEVPDAPGTASQAVAVDVQPDSALVLPSQSHAFQASVTGTSNVAVDWSIQEGPASGQITATGQYTAPATPGSYHVVATSRSDPTQKGVATVTVVVASPGSAPYLIGTAHHIWNMPLSAFYADIISRAGSVVDQTATNQFKDLHSRGLVDVRINVYTDVIQGIWSTPNDPLVTLRAGGSPWACPVDKSSQMHAPTIPYPGYTNTDRHTSVVDTAKGIVYEFYSPGGATFGQTGSFFDASNIACEPLRGDDGALATLTGAAARYGCTTGNCGLIGKGAGIPYGGSTLLGFLIAGSIRPEDFDDTDWTGEAVGTLHHLLYCTFPAAPYQADAMWPAAANRGYAGSSPIHIGSVLRINPNWIPAGGWSAYASRNGAWLARILKTWQAYGCVNADGAGSGVEMHALFDRVGNGANPLARTNPPWTAAGGANAEAVSTGLNGATIKFIPEFPYDQVEVVQNRGGGVW